MIMNLTAAEKVSFNTGWKFSLGEHSGAESATFDDSEWRTLDLPHDWAIEGPFAEEFGPRSGGLPYFGTGWYRKHFELEDLDEDAVVRLHFDGAMANAEIWVNGKKAGKRPYGYISFAFDISPFINRTGNNVVAVKLSPEILSSRWYPGAGIYRNTWLEIDKPVHLAHWGTTITTPKVNKKNAEVRFESQIVNQLAESARARVVVRILDESGNAVAEFSKNKKINSGETVQVSQSLKVKHPKLWDIDSPNLYTAETRLYVGDQVVDSERVSFGIRTFSFSADKGFELNGRRVQIQGVCLHHDLGPLGSAVNRRATERQLEIMKSMGVNAIRTSHNPPSPEQLEFCDKLGLIVQVEAFDCWEMAKVENGYNKHFTEWHEKDLRDMIRRDRNHPSVVMWSIGNEILEQGKKDGWKWARTLTAICKEEDSTRPVSAGFNYYPASVNHGLAAEIDIVGLNYHPASYGDLLKKHPDWVVLGSETSSCLSSRGVYHLPIEPYKKHPSHQLTSYDLIGPPWAYPPDMEFHFLDQNPQVIGEFVWTGFDYLGEPTPYGGRDNHTRGRWKGDWPSRSSYFGIVDLCGFPKDRYYLYQSRWTQGPMIHLLPHWSWEGRADQDIPVYCYTNCDSAELFLNGKSLGKRIKGKDTTPIYVDLYNWKGEETFNTPYRLRWDVPYAAGDIRVVGFRDGKALVEKEIRTAGAAAQIELKPDRVNIQSDGEDLSFITVIVKDGEGNLCPHSDHLIRFQIEGPGEIVAVGNGNPATTLGFQADYRPVFNGLCLVIVKAAENSLGEFTIKAMSEGLKTAEAKIIAQ